MLLEPELVDVVDTIDVRVLLGETLGDSVLFTVAETKGVALGLAEMRAVGDMAVVDEEDADGVLVKRAVELAHALEEAVAEGEDDEDARSVDETVVVADAVGVPCAERVPVIVREEKADAVLHADDVVVTVVSAEAVDDEVSLGERDAVAELDLEKDTRADGDVEREPVCVTDTRGLREVLRDTVGVGDTELLAEDDLDTRGVCDCVDDTHADALSDAVAESLGTREGEAVTEAVAEGEKLCEGDGLTVAVAITVADAEAVAAADSEIVLEDVMLCVFDAVKVALDEAAALAVVESLKDRVTMGERELDGDGDADVDGVASDENDTGAL